MLKITTGAGDTLTLSNIEQKEMITLYSACIEEYKVLEWAQGNLALDEECKDVSVSDTSVKYVCAEGCILRCINRALFPSLRYRDALLFLAHHLELNDDILLVSTWNDSLPYNSGSAAGKEAVVKAFIGARKQLKGIMKQ